MNNENIIIECSECPEIITVEQYQTQNKMCTYCYNLKNNWCTGCKNRQCADCHGDFSGATEGDR